MTTSPSKTRSTRKPVVTTPAASDIDIDSDHTNTNTSAGAGAPCPKRQAMIAEAAFFIAESRGFTPGLEFDDWLEAERLVGQQPEADKT